VVLVNEVGVVVFLIGGVLVFLIGGVLVGHGSG